ncbi:unnamed protein product [Callosobruchus maculatus]|uniref:DUF4485 domain-containing protein n=1 Tax=Callosobruchus maculatus TaxID=64391 RepID=A0A653CH14_CALMS|nr:unnamed protein product [Callosobruchus maculatus]
MGTTQLDENFFYNSMLAKAMVQMLPPPERKVIRLWFDKLMQTGETKEQKEIRNEYVWFILLMLQCKKVREPFNGPPPPELEPLRDIVSGKVYEEVMVGNDDNMDWLEKTKDKSKKNVQFGSTAPSQFFKSMPIPNDGVICYLSAFSDRGN